MHIRAACRCTSRAGLRATGSKSVQRNISWFQFAQLLKLRLTQFNNSNKNINKNTTPINKLFNELNWRQSWQKAKSKGLYFYASELFLYFQAIDERATGTQDRIEISLSKLVFQNLYRLGSDWRQRSALERFNSIFTIKWQICIRYLC